MGAAQVNTFLTHLAVKGKVAASTQNQALCALVFLYKQVLGIELGNFGDGAWAKRPQRLPVVLTREEVARLFRHLQGTHRIMGGLMYGAGLRLMECVRLRVKDVDFGYNQVLVRDGKGHKDRVTVLPAAFRDELEDHLKRVKQLFAADLAKGCCNVYLPTALERKYPNAPSSWGWQWVFPSAQLSTDPAPESSAGTTSSTSRCAAPSRKRPAKPPWPSRSPATACDTPLPRT
jgi:site-specific recombinase XerD